MESAYLNTTVGKCIKQMPPRDNSLSTLLNIFLALFSLVTSTTLIHYLLPTAVPIALLSGLAAVRITALFERVISERWRETYISGDVYTILGALITLALFAVYPAH